MTVELHTTQVDLVGLMEVLGKHLYSTPTVAIRELVQNAYDSCLRRWFETQDPSEPAICIITNQSKGTLVIEDNGAGLTREEIIKYITTVGSGYTKILRNEHAGEAFIGYFGLGFLTAYAVAKRIELWTTSYQEPDHGWHFVSAGAERYRVEPAKPRPIGTRLILHLSRKFLDLADPVVTERLVTRYCCLLPVPIYLNKNRETPLNILSPPWRERDEDTSSPHFHRRCLEFAKQFEDRFGPLCTVPIYSTAEYDVSGLLWIHDATTYGSSDNRNVSVFIRGMLVSRDERELLPSWAGFMGGILESNSLLPTASREDIQKDETYSKIQHYIKEQLITGLANIARKEVSTWRQILRRHNEALLGAAVADDRLFSMLAEDLKVPTSEGEMTIPAIRRRCENKIYISTGEKGGYEEVIFRALMKPVAFGYRYAVFPFCVRYGKMFGIKIIHLGTQIGDKYLFKPENITKEALQQLQTLLAKPGQEVVATRFQPDYLPLVLIPDREYQLKQLIETDEADHRISMGALRLARMYTEHINGNVAARLYINLNSPVIQKFLKIQGAMKEQVARLLRSFVYLITSHHEPEFQMDLSKEFKAYSEAMEKLLDSQVS